MSLLFEAFAECELFVVKHFGLHSCMKGAIRIKIIILIIIHSCYTALVAKLDPKCGVAIMCILFSSDTITQVS